MGRGLLRTAAENSAPLTIYMRESAGFGRAADTARCSPPTPIRIETGLLPMWIKPWPLGNSPATWTAQTRRLGDFGIDAVLKYRINGEKGDAPPECAGTGSAWDSVDGGKHSTGVVAALAEAAVKKSFFRLYRNPIYGCGEL